MLNIIVSKNNHKSLINKSLNHSQNQKKIEKLNYHKSKIFTFNNIRRRTQIERFIMIANVIFNYKYAKIQ